MPNPHRLMGVFSAAVTPIKPDSSPDLDGLIDLVAFLSRRGCHGVLLMGTTGEGPSLSIDERLQIIQCTAELKENLPELVLLAGTGTPSLEDTISLTKAAFNRGCDGVVVLPPYYFRKATDEGLFNWFSQVIIKSMPHDGALIGYHIPPVSGVSLGIDLLTRLKDTYPDQFLGIKDSSGDSDWARSLGNTFGPDLLVLNGNDRLFSLALKSGAAGCITAMANLLSPLHRVVWDKFQAGGDDEITQDKLTCAREVLDRYPPMPPILKLILSKLHGFPSWGVKPPLLDFKPHLAEIVLSEYLAALD